MIQMIDIKKLSPHPDNPRIDLGDLTELAESIKATGILQNLTVVPWFSEITRAPADDPQAQEEMGYRVVIGHRRLAAAKLAGLTELPCVVMDMTPGEQVATMLLENMQRNDLTIWEQAGGFQMMLNFGETVEDIGRQTGFSETTVRKRVKLLELDQDKFKASVERGATLLDFERLNKIKDLEMRNEVLGYVGTSNFNGRLEAALDVERREENAAKITKQLDKFADHVDDRDEWAGTSYVAQYSTGNSNIEIKVPDDADDGGYVYFTSDYWIELRRKLEPTAETVPEQDNSEFNARRDQLDEIATRAYKLRSDFIANYPVAKKHTDAIIKFAAWVLTRSTYSSGCNVNVAAKMLDIQVDEETDINNVLQKKAEEKPLQALLILAYSNLGDNPTFKYFATFWDADAGRKMGHVANDRLTAIYDMLINLGYTMSDEERQMQDGTHELLQQVGTQNDSVRVLTT